MCGIVGYVGDPKENQAKKMIIEGLKRLEYRGYDSAGIVLYVNGIFETRKHVGGLENLEKIIKDKAFNSHIGLGHTRWATHGAPSDVNAHPHSNEDNTVTIVHNGIIENYIELKEMLVEEYGVKFKSETDSEVIAHLIGINYKKEQDFLSAVHKTVDMMRGAYALVAVCAHEPDKIIGVRKDAPMIAGLGKGCNFIASDIPAFLKYVREVLIIENNETVIVTKDNVTILDVNRKPVKRETMHINWDVDAAEKGGYDHFMLKEIHEQPDGIHETLTKRIKDDGMINLDGISMTKEDIEGFNKVYIVACGTAYHAGLVGKHAIEKMTRIPVEVDVASEFRYRDPFVDDKTLFIAISQSGETLDTLAALREAKKKGARVFSVVNVVESSVARESDDVLYTWAGPEIAVASTKAYTTQLVCMYLIALFMGKTKGSITEEYYNEILEELKAMPGKMRNLLTQEEKIAKLAKKFKKKENIFFIGRGPDCGVAYEGSLKLKEISYINSFAIAAGELKHGTIALIEQDTLVIALDTQDLLFEKMLSNIVETKARGAYVLAVAKEGHTDIEAEADSVIYIPECRDEVSPILSVVTLQIFAYYVAKERGCNIDKPKNLAKSVTVE